MNWNIKVYEEPGILFADRMVDVEEAPFAEVEELMKPGVEQERVLLAVLNNTENDEPPLLCPASESVDEPFEELAEKLTGMLSEGQIFAAASMADGALKGAHGQDVEVRLLVASIFEHVGFWDFALPVLQSVENKMEDELRQAAIQIRIARALRKNGATEDVSARIDKALEYAELPPVLRVEGLLLKAMGSKPEEGIEILDELLDYAEEHLGDHRLVADALELNADFLSVSEPAKAEHFFHAAGKMLAEMGDPYFFSMNERFVMHLLRNQEYEKTVHLSHEMFELLKQAGGPPIASVPYFVFASRAHAALGDVERSEFATKTARDIHEVEAKRLEQMVDEILAQKV